MLQRLTFSFLFHYRLLDTLLANAFQKTLEILADEGTGWSKACKFNFWASLFDRDHSYKVFQKLLKNSTPNNLFDNCPPLRLQPGYTNKRRI